MASESDEADDNEENNSEDQSDIGKPVQRVEDASIGQLLRALPQDWDGLLGGQIVPTSLHRLQSLQTRPADDDGIFRWRLCVGRAKESEHELQVFEPSDEDKYFGRGLLRCGCICEDGSKMLKRNCSSHAQRCSLCHQQRKYMIPLDEASLQYWLQQVFSVPTFAHEGLQAWRCKKEWDDGAGIIKEFWHGAKFKEIRAFVDEEQVFELPICCSRCEHVYKAFPESQRAPELTTLGDGYDFCCSKCHHQIKAPKRFLYGDPRNILLQTHMDGYTVGEGNNKRKILVMEATVLNTGHETTLQPYPFIFAPESLLGSVNAFQLAPILMDIFSRRLRSYFMDGFPVRYGEEVAGLRREFTMRVLWFHHTGDNVAHCQLGGFRSRGKAGCRRCLVYAEQIAPRSSEYVYNNNRRELRFPPVKRTAEDTFKLLKEAENAPTETEKEQKLLDSGLSKATSVWKLFQLYGFDPGNDFVFDILHTIALNVIKKYVDDFLDRFSLQETQQLLDVIYSALPKTLRQQDRFEDVSGFTFPPGITVYWTPELLYEKIRDNNNSQRKYSKRKTQQTHDDDEVSSQPRDDDHAGKDGPSLEKTIESSETLGRIFSKQEWHVQQKNTETREARCVTDNPPLKRIRKVSVKLAENKECQLAKAQFQAIQQGLHAKGAAHKMVFR